MSSDAIAGQRIAEFKAKLHSLFIGGCYTSRSNPRSQGALFVFTEKTREAAVLAMAMSLEASLGSDVQPEQYTVTVIEADDHPETDVLARRGYMGWQLTGKKS